MVRVREQVTRGPKHSMFNAAGTQIAVGLLPETTAAET
jgi:hypothetical protein